MSPDRWAFYSGFQGRLADGVEQGLKWTGRYFINDFYFPRLHTTFSQTVKF